MDRISELAAICSTISVFHEHVPSKPVVPLTNGDVAIIMRFRDCVIRADSELMKERALQRLIYKVCEYQIL